MLIDAHPDADAVLVQLWRRMTPDERFARADELTEINRQNAKRAIQQAQPEELGMRRTHASRLERVVARRTPVTV